MCDEESQADELLALENIYTQEEFKSLKENDQLGGHFFAFVVLENEWQLTFKDLRESESCFQELSLEYLPPLSLLFSFPKDYPSSAPPDFTLSCQWLHRLEITKLCKKLDTIWNENKGMEIMYIWTQFLKEESLKFLGIDKKLDISTMYTHHVRYMEYRHRRSRGVFKREERSSSNTSVRVPVEQTSVEKGAGETAISKENGDCSEKPTLFADKNHGAEENCRHGEEASSSAVIPAEENQLIEGAVQKCCKNLKSVEQDSTNNMSNFSKEKPEHSKESRYSRRHRPSIELKVRRKKQNINSQTNVEPPKDCDSNRDGEVMCSVFQTELDDTEKNCHTNSKFCKRQGGNNTRRTKLSSDSEHTTANELCKTDMKFELASSNDCTCARGKGSSRQRRCIGRPRNGPAEQEKETRQPQVRHRFKYDLDNRAILDLDLQTSVIQHLLEYNNRRRELLFERSLNTCKICFEEVAAFVASGRKWNYVKWLQEEQASRVR